MFEMQTSARDCSNARGSASVAALSVVVSSSRLADAIGGLLLIVLLIIVGLLLGLQVSGLGG